MKPITAHRPALSTLDVELIDLGRKLDGLLLRHADAVARFKPSWTAHREALEKWRGENPGYTEQAFVTALKLSLSMSD